MKKTTPRRSLSVADIAGRRPAGVYNVRYMAVEYLIAYARDIVGDIAHLARDADQAATEGQFPEAIAATAQSVEEIEVLGALHAAAGELIGMELSRAGRARQEE